MIEALVAILCGLLLLSSLFRAETAGLVGALKPFETVIGVIAVVVGILAITSLTGIALIVAGLVLAISALSSVPVIGGYLRRAGEELARFHVVIGVIVLVIGILGLIRAL